MEIRFDAKKTKQGNSFIVVIPKAIANLLEEKEYRFTISEIQESNDNGKTLFA